MSLDYLELFLRSGPGDPTSALSLIFLCTGRIAPLIGLSTFFGARILPAPVKIAMALCFVAISFPKVLLSTSGPVPFDTGFIILMMRELMIGTLMGFMLGLPFLMASAAGVFIDHQRGAASLMTNDPTIQNQSSPIGTLYNLLLVAAFWGIGGPFYVLDALYDSYQLLPPDSWRAPNFMVPHGYIHTWLLKSLQVFALVSLQLAMPAFLAMLMTDTFLGIINRLAPQVQITFLGMGFKSWFAILIVCIGLPAFMQELGKQIESWVIDFKVFARECCIEK